jgi:DNA-binding IclR family transcriptional regulator/predicted dehydrogenase
MPTALIQSLHRGLILLETVAKARRPLGLDELAEVLGVDRSSAFRLANTLKFHGMLAQLPETKEYVLGSAIGRLARLSPWGEVLSLFARQEVAALAARTQETTHLAVREGRQAALIHHHLTDQPVGVSTGSGHCVPLFCTSVGRALLLDYDEKALRALFGGESFPTYNRLGVGSVEALAEECERGRQRGYAIDDQEYNDGVRCVAAPIRDPSGEVVASIGISAPVHRLPEERIPEIGRIVMEAASRVSARLGENVPESSKSIVAFATGATSAFVSGSDVIKVALVGCGSRGTGAASQCLQTKGPIQLWAMADLFADRLESSLAQLVKGEAADYDREAHEGLGSRIQVPKERQFVGFDAYQKAVDSGVDLVILATPPQFRPSQFEYAVKQGKHLFVEKPVAVDACGIRQMLAANEEAKKKNLKIGVGLMLRHNKRIQETVQRIHDGALGQVPLWRCYWNTGQLRDTPPRPATVSEMMYQLRNPYHFLWLSGDYIIDALLHFLDICCWAKGDYPVCAQGQGGRIVFSETQRGDTYDFHCVEYQFADGSVLAAQTRQIAGCWGNASSHANGVLGSAEIDRGVIHGVKKWHFRGNIANPYQVEHDVLIDAIRNDRPHNEVEYGAKSTMAAILGRMASYSGQKVAWDAALQSNVRLGPEQYSFDAVPPVVANAQGVYPIAIPGVGKIF